MPKATRFAPPLVALFLGLGAYNSAAEAGWFSFDSKPDAPAAKKDDKPAPQATTLDDSIRQAQMLRLAGNYAEAINHLSQVMLVAADDPRVIREYGKTLVAMGRAEEAEKFLTRAQQLEPNDWTVYSALGVAYDEVGNQKDAQLNYERALTLKPGDPGVLSNYALSRMLAKDPAMARTLADRAEIANAATHDDKIARDIAMIRSMAPADGLAVNAPAPAPVAAPHVAVVSAPLAPVEHVSPVLPATRPAPVASNTRPLAGNAAIQAGPQTAQMPNLAPRGVVMQPVPVDPPAGPVAPRPAATHAPTSLQPKAVAKADAPKAAEPGAFAAKVSLPLKADDVKPNSVAQPAPKVLPPQPVKAADTKPQADKAKTAAAKDAIPGLRISANAY